MTDEDVEAIIFDLDVRKDGVDKIQRQIKDISGAIAVANATLRSLRLILAELKASKVVLAAEYRSVKNGMAAAKKQIAEGKEVLAELQRSLNRQNKEILELETSLQKSIGKIGSQPAGSTAKVLGFVNEKYRRDEVEDPE